MLVLAQVFTADWLTELWVHLPILFVRTLLIFTTVLVVVRWTGKRSIANLAPFDMAMVIMIGEVAAIPVSELRVDLLHGIFPVVLIGGLHLAVTTISLYSKTFERWTEGRPTLLVKNGKVVDKNMRRERVSMSDLVMALRHKEIMKLSDVKEAWIEHAGGISVIRKDEPEPVTPQMLEDRLDEVEERLDQAVEEVIERVVRANAALMRQELAELVRRQGAERAASWQAEPPHH